MVIVDLANGFDGFCIFEIGLADLRKGFNGFEMGFCIFEVDSTNLVKSLINFKMGLADLSQGFLMVLKWVWLILVGILMVL